LLFVLGGCADDPTSPVQGDAALDAQESDAASEAGDPADSTGDTHPEIGPDVPRDTAHDVMMDTADADPHDASDVADAPQDLPDVPEPVRACNGHPDLCARRFDEVTLATTHNAMSNEAEGWLGPNQQFGITRQLEDGVRGMMLDTHHWEGDLYLCHTICNFGSKLLVDGLQEIADFMRDNPNEVLAIIFQDGISPEETASAFADSGLLEFVYTPGPGPWPTLDDMVDANERLLVTAEASSPPPAWYLHAWDVVFDTPYNFDSSDAFSCDLNRGQASNDLFLINHWITIVLPSPDGAAEVNQYEPLYNRAMACAQERGHHPNFLAVDFYATGDLFRVVDALNGVGE
jgi:hypothetical protein